MTDSSTTPWPAPPSGLTEPTSTCRPTGTFASSIPSSAGRAAPASPHLLIYINAGRQSSRRGRARRPRRGLGLAVRTERLVGPPAAGRPQRRHFPDSQLSRIAFRSPGAWLRLLAACAGGRPRAWLIASWPPPPYSTPWNRTAFVVAAHRRLRRGKGPARRGARGRRRACGLGRLGRPSLDDLRAPALGDGRREFILPPPRRRLSTPSQPLYVPVFTNGSRGTMFNGRDRSPCPPIPWK